MPAMRFTIRGADRVITNLKTLGVEFPGALGRALYKFAEKDIAGPAKTTYVPVKDDGGTLRSSIRVEPPVVNSQNAYVMVAAGGAAAPYAKSVHENPRAGKTGGFSPSGRRYKYWSRVGEWKFIETPARLAAADGVGFVRAAKEELSTVIKGLR